MPSHRRSLDHEPLKPTMGTCARQCSASATQCPARADASWCTTLPGSACVRARASVAAMQRARRARSSQAQSPATAGTPHRRLWSTSGTGRSTSHAHADSARALSASAFGPTRRHPGASVHRPRVCWPRSSSAALCRSPPQAPGHGTEPLSGQQPASNGTTGTCAGHCRAGARQCPANPDASLVHRPPPPASVCAQASSAVLWRRPVHGTPHAPRRGPVDTTEPLLWSTCGSWGLRLPLCLRQSGFT